MLGSLIQDLNQWDAAAEALLSLLVALKSIFGNISGVGVSQVVVSSVFDSSSSSFEAVRSTKEKESIQNKYDMPKF